MKNAKRMFAFISALALAFSYNAPSFVAIAEDTVDLKDSVGLNPQLKKMTWS